MLTKADRTFTNAQCELDEIFGEQCVRSDSGGASTTATTARARKAKRFIHQLFHPEVGMLVGEAVGLSKIEFMTEVSTGDLSCST